MLVYCGSCRSHDCRNVFMIIFIYYLFFVWSSDLMALFVISAVVERLLKKHTQVKVPLPSKKCSVSRVKVLE